jgi:hypothetical protein
MFVQAHNAREIGRLLNDGQQVTFVSSFARSGNTWVRYLLSDILLQNHGVETATELAVHPDEMIPDFYCEMIAKRNREIPTPGLLVKTHDVFGTLLQKFGNHVAPAPDGSCRHLYIYRTPEDSLVSFYHLQLREKYVKGRNGLDIDGFCLDATDEWIAHVSSYLSASESGASIFFASYDQLLKTPETVLIDMLQWLGVRHTSAAVTRAVENMRFGKLQALEARDLQDKTPVFRMGRNGSGSSELKGATVTEIRRRTDDLLAKAGECVARQKAGCAQHDRSIGAEPDGGTLSRNGRAEAGRTSFRARSV